MDKLSRCKFSGQKKIYLKMKLTKIAIERGQCNLDSGPIHFFYSFFKNINLFILIGS